MRKDTEQLIKTFLEFMKEQLGLSDLPPIRFVGRDFAPKNRAFAQIDNGEITVQLKGRHPMDVLRSLAHEIVHHAKQHTDGSDGSDDENEANALAGKFMREFAGKSPDSFGLMPESINEWGNIGSLQSFFGTSRSHPSGFEVANDGQVRQPGKGPDSSADAGEMLDTDRMAESMEQRIQLVWAPGSYGSSNEKVLKNMDRNSPLRAKLDSAGSHASIMLTPQEASELEWALASFLADRVYTKSEVKFAEDVIEQLGKSAGSVDVTNLREIYDFGDDSGDDAMAYRINVMTIMKEQGFPTSGITEEMIAYGMNSGLSEKQFVEQMFGVRLNEAYDANIDSFERQDMKKIDEISAELRKSSRKEKEEHPWATPEQALKIAKDHEREGKMENVFRVKS